jgi:gas vesicle structural protein
MAEQISGRASGRVPEGAPTRAPEIVLIGNEESPDLTLLDLIDHVLNTGVIIRGNLVLSLAGVDLVYLGLDLIVTSVETAMRHIAKPGSTERPVARRHSRRRLRHRPS